MLLVHQRIFIVDHHAGSTICRSSEAIMSIKPPPSKYVIREYLERRSHSNRPPPSLEEIRRQLGWQLLKPDPSRCGND
jgi:hypothetical protein